ncbi:MAG: hypothetical protein F6J93_12185 [Oscillatoria sp. SIO1A7]|nr:hypothetical protein [Oscillatoria sp. SIO1A7]
MRLPGRSIPKRQVPVAIAETVSGMLSPLPDRVLHLFEKRYILLKTVKLEDPFGENTLGDRWENLAEIFGNAVRCPIGRPPQKLSQLRDRFSLASAAKTH